MEFPLHLATREASACVVERWIIVMGVRDLGLVVVQVCLSGRDCVYLKSEVASVACHDPSVPPTIPIAIYPVIVHSLALIEDILEFIETVLIIYTGGSGLKRCRMTPCYVHAYIR